MTKAKDGVKRTPSRRVKMVSLGRGLGSVPEDTREQLIKYIEMCVKVVGFKPDNIEAFSDNKIVTPFKYLRERFGDVGCLLEINELLQREGYPDLIEESYKLRRLTFEK